MVGLDEIKFSNNESYVFNVINGTRGHTLETTKEAMFLNSFLSIASVIYLSVHS